MSGDIDVGLALSFVLVLVLIHENFCRLPSSYSVHVKTFEKMEVKNFYCVVFIPEVKQHIIIKNTWINMTFN